MIKVPCPGTSQCIFENRISIFPRHGLWPDKNYYINCTKHIDNTKKWTLPEKISPQKQFSPASPIPMQNWYPPISQLDEHSTDFDISNISLTFRLSQTCSKNSGETMVATSTHKQIKELNSLVVTFLKSGVLRKEDISVLEHGLNFCPSLKHYHKKSLKDSFYWFIRCLKLCQYFFNSELIVNYWK